ncbi:MAG: hypothetical protein WA096_09050, partial [Smithella sp.]
FDEGGLATPIRCGYLGTVRRKGRKQISQPKEVIASSLLYPDFRWVYKSKGYHCNGISTFINEILK